MLEEVVVIRCDGDGGIVVVVMLYWRWCVMDIVVREVYVFINNLLFILNLYLLSHIWAQLF